MRVIDQDAYAIVSRILPALQPFQMTAAGRFVVFPVIDAVERFVQMDGASRRGIELASPVVKAESEIGGFLDLGDFQSAARCVDGAGRDKETIARLVA